MKSKDGLFPQLLFSTGIALSDWVGGSVYHSGNRLVTRLCDLYSSDSGDNNDPLLTALQLTSQEIDQKPPSLSILLWPTG